MDHGSLTVPPVLAAPPTARAHGPERIENRTRLLIRDRLSSTIFFIPGRTVNKFIQWI